MSVRVAFDTASAVSVDTTQTLTRTFIVTDIFGSTHLNAALGDTTWSRVLMFHNRILRDEIAAQGGELVKLTGDGVFAAFESPAKALTCAVTMLGRFPLPLLGCPGRNGLRVAAGVCRGQAVAVAHDYLGLAVTMTFRLAERAHPGEILLTEDVLGGAAPPPCFRGLGPISVRGFTEPVPVYSLRPPAASRRGPGAATRAP